MRIQPSLAIALGLGLFAVQALADDKITFKLQPPPGTTCNLATRVALASQMRAPAPPQSVAGAVPPPAPAGGPAAPSEPGSLTATPALPPPGLPPPPAPVASATVGMETSVSAALDATYKVEGVDAKGVRLLKPTLPRPNIKLVPVPLGFDPNAVPWGIAPSLGLKVAPTGEAEVVGLAEFAKAPRDAAAPMMPLQAQVEALKAQMKLATYWMPRKAVGVGDSWPMKLEIPLPGAEMLAAPIGGTCTLLARDHGRSRIGVKGAATGTLVVDEASGWLVSGDLKVDMPGPNAGVFIVGRIAQQSAQ